MDKKDEQTVETPRKKLTKLCIQQHLGQLRSQLLRSRLLMPSL